MMTALLLLSTSALANEYCYVEGEWLATCYQGETATDFGVFDDLTSALEFCGDASVAPGSDELMYLEKTATLIVTDGGDRDKTDSKPSRK